MIEFIIGFILGLVLVAFIWGSWMTKGIKKGYLEYNKKYYTIKYKGPYND